MADTPPAGPADDALDAYRRAVVAGHRGDAATARQLLGDPAPLVRQGALAALVRVEACTAADLLVAFDDPAPVVRARAAELAIAVDGVTPVALLADDDASVVEAASFACGETAWSGDAPTEQLSAIATGHDDPLCREAAAAALGAIGDPAGLDAVLVACGDRVTVRRRATLALAAFDDPRADDALRAALGDRDWQVRQAAEDLLEVGRVLDGPEDPDAYADVPGLA